jgi:hypothetical protein
MRHHSMIVAAALGLALAMPALADTRDPFAEFDARLEALLAPEAWLKGRVTEADVTLLFAHLKAALLAASRGKQVPVPEALNRRAEELGRELKIHGVLTGLLLLDALEAGARQAVREGLAARRTWASDRLLTEKPPADFE